MTSQNNYLVTVNGYTKNLCGLLLRYQLRCCTSLAPQCCISQVAAATLRVQILRNTTYGTQLMSEQRDMNTFLWNFLLYGRPAF